MRYNFFVIIFLFFFSNISSQNGKVILFDQAHGLEESNNFQVKVIDENSVHVTWKPILRAAKYSIYKNGEWVAGNSGKDENDGRLNYIDTNISDGETNIYKVIAIMIQHPKVKKPRQVVGEQSIIIKFLDNVEVQSEEQVTSKNETQETANNCSSELVLSLQPDSSVKLCWPLVQNSEGYSVYRNDKWVYGASNRAAVENIVSLVDTDVLKNKSYVYKVISRATNPVTGKRKNTLVGEAQITTSSIQIIITEEETEDANEEEPSETGPTAPVVTTPLNDFKDYCVDGKTISSTDSGKKLAFPCAKGYGRFAEGGNVKGALHYTINDKGSSVLKGDGKITVKEFAEALGDVKPGCRYADVSVGGFADWGMQSISTKKNGDGCFTIAFHTAPGNGLLMGYQKWEFKGKAENMILHFPKMIGNEATTQGFADTSSAIRVVTTGSVNNFIIRNATVRNFADDQVILAYNHETATATHSDLTIQDSAVYEGDAWSKHEESQPLMSKKNYIKSDWYYHATGISCSGHTKNKVKPERCSVIKNFLAHNAIRTPRFNGGTGETIDNIVYNWRLRAMDIHSKNNSKGWSYIEGNFYKAGPSSEDRTPFKIEPYSRPFYVKNNIWQDQVGNQKKAIEFSGKPNTARATVSTELPNLSCVGAWIPKRDSETTRVINEYKNGTGEVGIGSVPQDPKCPSKHCAVGESERVTTADYPDVKRSKSFDTDGDGIPNSWEEKHGLDPNDPSDGGRFEPGEVYNNWHKYIHSIVANEGRKKGC